MNSIRKAVFPAQYIQGQGVLNDLPILISRMGSRGLILASEGVIKNILPVFADSSTTGQIPVERFNRECSEDELARTGRIIRETKTDVLVGMGGGKVIDTAKIAADRANIPVIIVPTIASTDAPCSGCAVVYSSQGIFEKVCYQKRNPDAVLVDVDVIVQSPVRFLVSGMGDALATWFEARSCERTQSPNECGGLSTLTGLHLARLCYDTLLTYGTAAKIANMQKIVTPALNHIIEANILLSGIGFESSGLAAAHAIHNGLTAIRETHDFYHGEKVAYGVLSGLHLTGADPQEINEVYTFCEKIGLPTTLEDIGISKPDLSRLLTVAGLACESGQSIHHEAGQMTPEMVLNAMLMANAMGQARKAGTLTF